MNPPAWDAEKLVNPHVAEDKRARVQKMFAAIAPSYDLNNHLHSLYIDQYWRRQAVRLAEVKATDRIVDVACGTGDLIEAFRQATEFPDEGDYPDDRLPRYIGVDFTYEMLPIAHRKSAFFDLATTIHYFAGDAQALPLPDASADVVSIAFGIRNVQNPLTALREFKRILRPGGRVIVLEFAVPKNPIVRTLYNFYCAKVMPLTATWISGDRSGAYRYLPHSVATFLTREQMITKLAEAGFANVTATPLTFGTVMVYRGFV
jgi:demethylmenaquinone methyltransferase/2-methoxy-6-polyprenyl-1,4-benzoquinol methylase